MKNNERKLFELLEAIGETLTGDLHIIDNTDEFPAAGEQSFRVYHKDGYCFDSKRRVDEIGEDNETIVAYEYDFFAEWHGFKKLTVEKALTLLE